MIQIFADGACEPVNPNGIATYGFVIYMNNERIAEGSGVIADKNPSNNTAEYTAAIKAFSRLLKKFHNELSGESIILNSDSQLLINQLIGTYKVSAQRILPLYTKLKRLIKKVKQINPRPKIRFSWIPREENEEADGRNKTLIVPESFPTKYSDPMLNEDPTISYDNTIILFDHGIYNQGFYYVEDPTGEWKDSDGDGVWDGIDGAPFDPTAGYIKDEIKVPLLLWLTVLVLASLIIAVIVILFVLRREKRKKNGEKFLLQSRNIFLRHGKKWFNC